MLFRSSARSSRYDDRILPTWSLPLPQGEVTASTCGLALDPSDRLYVLSLTESGYRNWTWTVRRYIPA